MLNQLGAVSADSRQHGSSAPPLLFPDAAGRDTLVTYVFDPEDATALGNLRFFVHTAMREADRSHYVIVIQSARAHQVCGWHSRHAIVGQFGQLGLSTCN